MSIEHLQGVMQSSHALYNDLPNKIKHSAIVNIFTLSGDCIKIKGDKDINVMDITPDYITVSFDSHIADIMYNSIERIEYFGGLYGRNNNK